MGNGKPIPVDFEVRRFAVEGKVQRLIWRNGQCIYSDILCGKEENFEGCCNGDTLRQSWINFCHEEKAVT